MFLHKRWFGFTLKMPLISKNIQYLNINNIVRHFSAKRMIKLVKLLLKGLLSILHIFISELALSVYFRILLAF